MMAAEEITLRDGTKVTIRPISANDKEALRRAFSRLSPASRYLRFHSHKQALTDADLKYLTEVNGTDHVALVATVPSHDMREDVGVGVGRFVRDPKEFDLAEAAITVADDFQGRGLGKVLLRRLADCARECGVRRFQAEVLTENAPMVHLLRASGALVVRSDGSTLVLEVPVAPAAELESEETPNPLFRVLRTFATTLAALMTRARPPWGDAFRPSEVEEFVIGVDLGGTKTEAVVAKRSGLHNLSVLTRKRIPTQTKDGYDGVLASVATLVQSLATEADLDITSVPIGIGMPGSITRRDGLTKNSNTVCLNGRPFRTDLETRLGRKVAFDNDANCFALAEARLGAAMSHVGGVVFGVILGTGVGGGIVVRGEVWPGSQGIAGEWGHHAVWPSREQVCYCGRTGCLEMFASGPALERAYIEKSGNRLPLIEIVERRETDGCAHEVLDDFLETFGRGLANVIDVLDPSAIVLGGGVSNIDCLYTEGITRVARYVFNDELTTPILKNALGDSAGVLGAALIAQV